MLCLDKLAKQWVTDWHNNDEFIMLDLNPVEATGSLTEGAGGYARLPQRARTPSGVVKRRYTTRGLCHRGRRSGRTTAKRIEPRRRGGLIPDRPRPSGIQ